MQDAAIAGLKQKNVLLTEENESLRLQLEKSLLLQQQEGNAYYVKFMAGIRHA